MSKNQSACQIKIHRCAHVRPILRIYTPGGLDVCDSKRVSGRENPFAENKAPHVEGMRKWFPIYLFDFPTDSFCLSSRAASAIFCSNFLS